jgi:H+/Cl- antiporter ClcA
MRRRLAVAAFGLAVSALIGLGAAAFLIADNALTALLWDGPLPPALVVGVAALALWGLQGRWPAAPRTAAQAMAAMKTGTTDYRDLLPTLAATLVILAAGAGVGAAAALLSAVIVASVWQADKMRYLYFHHATLAALPLGQRLARVLHPGRFVTPYAERHLTAAAAHRAKRLAMGLMVANGLVAFALLMRATDQPKFIARLGTAGAWHPGAWWVALPLAVAFGLLGWALRRTVAALHRGAARLTARWSRWSGAGTAAASADAENAATAATTAVKPAAARLAALRRLAGLAVGAAAILAVAAWAPALLFSGQHSVHLLVTHWQGAGAATLALVAAGKLALLAVCQRTGWRGGDIFPVLFAGFALGFAVATLLSGQAALVVVAAVATAFAGALLGSPVIAGVMVALFCPPVLWPVVGVAGVIAWLGQRFLPAPAAA